MPKVDGPALVTQAEYARRRGVSREAVRKAVDAGRISVLGNDKLIDPAVADIQWEQNSRKRVAPPGKVDAPAAGQTPAAPPAAQRAAEDLVEAAANAAGAEGAEEPPTPKAGPTYQDARTRREIAEAEEAEMRAAKTAGRLIEKPPAVTATYTAFRGLRDSCMMLGRKLSPSLAAMSNAREIQLLIEQGMRDAFEAFRKKTLADLASRLNGAPVDLPADLKSEGDDAAPL